MTPEHELAAWRKDWLSASADSSRRADRLDTADATRGPFALAFRRRRTSRARLHERGADRREALRALIQQQSRRLRLFVGADILATILMGGGITAWMLRNPTPAMVQLTIAVWGFITAAWVFTLKNRRGLWTPSAQTTSAFLALAIRRCEHRLVSTVFVALLGAAEFVFMLIWTFRQLRQMHNPQLTPAEFLTSMPVIQVTLCGLAALAAVAWYRVRTQAELDGLLALRRQFADAASRESEDEHEDAAD